VSGLSLSLILMGRQTLCHVIKTSHLPSLYFDSFESEEDYLIIHPRKHKKPECTNERRCYAMYGIRFLTCVCDAIPVSKLDLEAIKFDCYFATAEISDMEPHHIRNT
jgi:hypothetical protein